jgi:prepilin signal peptidase PulO-like enzyme (type II secretory pathway)
VHVLITVLCGVAGTVAGGYVTPLAERALAGVPLLRPPPAFFATELLRSRQGIGLTLGTGLLFAALAWRLGPVPVLPAYLYLAGVCVVLALVDIRTRRLPDPLTLPSYPIGAALLGIAVPFTGDGVRHFASALIGMAVLYAIYAVLFFINPNGIGWGDVKLAGVLGLYLGWLGLPVWATGMFLGFLLGALFGLGLILARRATRKTPIPFGPFMIAGTLLAVCVGSSIAGTYLDI